MTSAIRRPAGPKRIQPLKQIAGIGKRIAPKRAVAKLPAPKPVVKKVAVKSRLTHFEHVEDYLIDAGFEGYTHAVAVLKAVHATMTGTPDAVLTEKYDGSPSIVFGIYPETGKFFVATKSFFNKVPKINYTHEDIVRNHGYSEELVAKLGKALEHLPKITPERGVFQGDLMHVAGMNIEETEDQVRFNANTITYSTPSRSEEGKRLLASQISIAVHTEHDLGPRYADTFPTLRSHPDVCVISVKVDLAKIYYPLEAQDAFKWNMDRAADLAHKIPASYPKAAEIKKYINRKIKECASPFAADSSDLDQMFYVHQRLQKAKDILNHALSFTRRFNTSIDGVATKGEGFVAVLHNKPTKLVNRAEFSKQNFLRQQFKDSAAKTSPKIIMAVARMNPPTIGHQRLVEKVKQLADLLSSKHIIFLSSSHDSTRNPLSPESKLAHAQRLFPDTNFRCFNWVAGENLLKDFPNNFPGFLSHVTSVYKEGAEYLILVAGSDRTENYEEMMDRYNGPLGPFNFKKITVVSAGDRREGDGVEGMSATRMREYAETGNYSAFIKGLPPTTEDHARELYDEVRKGLGL